MYQNLFILVHHATLNQCADCAFRDKAKDSSKYQIIIHASGHDRRLTRAWKCAAAAAAWAAAAIPWAAPP